MGIKYQLRRASSGDPLCTIVPTGNNTELCTSTFVKRVAAVLCPYHHKTRLCDAIVLLLSSLDILNKQFVVDSAFSRLLNSIIDPLNLRVYSYFEKVVHEVPSESRVMHEIFLCKLHLS